MSERADSHSLSLLDHVRDCAGVKERGVAMYRISVLALFVAVASPLIAHADGVADCNKTLVIENATGEASIAEKIAALSSITRSEFEQMDQSANHKGNVVVYGIPITGDWNWDKFDEKRREFIDTYKFDSDLSSRVSWKTSYLSARAPEVYANCIRGLPTLGAHMWVAEGGPNSRDLNVRVVFRTDSKTKRRAEVKVTNGRLVVGPLVQSKLDEFKGDELNVAITVTRESLVADTLLTLNVSDTANGAASLLIPATPSIQKKVMRQVVLDKTIQTTSGKKPAANSQHRQRICVPNTPREIAELGADGYLLPDRMSFEAIASGRGGDNHATEVKTKTSYCLNTNIGVDGDGHERSVSWHMMAVGERPEWIPVDVDGREIKRVVQAENGL